jgi:hypothetical protein
MKGKPRLLTTLDDMDWNKLEHAYGPATDTPNHHRALTSSDPKQRKAAWDALGGSIYHQGSIYPATTAAVPFLIELLDDDPSRRNRGSSNSSIASSPGIRPHG